ncbi:MAG: hypothetical protein R3260_03465 [Pseudomonas sp.]|nr:hypothetical protein [Pseudomonas sp.]
MKARIKLGPFSGEVPRTGRHYLPEHSAEQAENLKLNSGELRGVRRLKPTRVFSSAIEKAYRLPDALGASNGYTWVGLDSRDTEIFRGPLLNDEYDRFYMFGDGAPQYNTIDRIRNGDSWYLLGIPEPDQDCTVTPGSGSETDVDRFYCYTFVSAYGEEGPPSNPVQGTGAPDATWTIGNLDTTPADAASRNITHKRIYRTVQGLTTSEFFFVAEVTLATTSYADTLGDSTVSLNNPLESSTWAAPPSDIIGTVLLPNGFFCAWDADSNLHFSEPYRPHAWPAQYDLSTEFEILGGGIFGQSAAIVTTANPYIATGVNPASITLTKSTTVEPGLSKYGIVSMPYGVIYPSQNGLVMIGAGGIDIITRKLLTKNEWVNDYSPETLWAAQYEDAYIGFYNATTGFMIDPREPQTGFIQLTNYSNVSFVQTDYYTGDVLITIDDTIYTWDDPTEFRDEYRWKSRVVTFPKPCNLGACRIEMASDSEALDDINYPADDVQAWNAERIGYPLAEIGGNVIGGETQMATLTNSLPYKFDASTQPIGGSPIVSLTQDYELFLQMRLTVYACDCDGNMSSVFSEYVSTDRCIRLPSGFKSDRWQFEMVGRRAVYHLKVAETCKGLEDA